MFVVNLHVVGVCSPNSRQYHDSDTIKISVKALFLKISKTVCYNLVKRFLKNEESLRVTIFKLFANL